MRLRVFLLAAVLALSWSGTAQARDPFAPRAWSDAAEFPDSPLDLREVSFGQRETELWLTVRTYGPLSEGLGPDSGVCLELIGDGAVCLRAGRDGRVVVGRRVAGALRAIPGATVSKRSGRSVSVRFHARAARLRFGKARWFVASQWQADGACAAGCEDRAPARGHRTAKIGVLGRPRCYGAAARAGRRPCRNPALGRTVTPRPFDALLMSDLPCRPRETRYAVIKPCEFGYLDEPRAPAVALIGDSHSAHLRAAVDVVAQARGWRAVSITSPGCAFSTDLVPNLPKKVARCRRHSNEALRWLRAHPSVHVVFTSNLAGRATFGPAGFRAIWRRVPASVNHIHVIRDVPHVAVSTAACVSAVIRRHERAGNACTLPRAAAIAHDPSAVAAAAARGRVHLIDLTRYFCDAARCHPVVGGAYVYRDDNHVNRAFATTLGPYLLRRLR